jgi:hypothetical protein
MEEFKEEPIREILERVFAPDIFTVKQQTNDFFLIETLDRKECLQLIIRPPVIYVHQIHKCGIKGDEILQKIDELAKQMPNIKSLSLLDGSEISKCGIDLDLATIKILTKGESWYNSKGYVSTNYDDEKKQHAEIMNLEFAAFIDKFKNSASIKERCAELFPELDMKTNVKTYFNSVLDIINREDCVKSTEKIQLLKTITDMLQRKEVYDRTLEKKVNKTKGGKTKGRRRRTKKRKSTMMRRTRNR